MPRILRDGLCARLHRDAWQWPALFQWLQAQGGVADQEMARVFNCGIGMVLVVGTDQAAAITATLQAQGETVYTLGQIEAQAVGGAQTIVD